jgi:hypothetical protein
VDIYPYKAQQNQQWVPRATSGGYYTVQGVQSGLNLDVIGASTKSGAGIDIWTNNGGNNQQWEFESP